MQLGLPLTLMSLTSPHLCCPNHMASASMVFEKSLAQRVCFSLLPGDDTAHLDLAPMQQPRKFCAFRGQLVILHQREIYSKEGKYISFITYSPTGNLKPRLPFLPEGTFAGMWPLFRLPPASPWSPSGAQMLPFLALHSSWSFHLECSSPVSSD